MHRPRRSGAGVAEGGRRRLGRAVAGALPYLQRAALTPHLRDLARSHEVDLKELRAAAGRDGQRTPGDRAAAARPSEGPPVTAALVFAAYVLISQLAEIGFDTIADELRHADPGWIGSR